MKAVVLLVILQSLCLVLGQSDRGPNECYKLTKSTCSNCLEIAGCAWCSDESYQGLRCNTPSKLADGGCPKNYTVNPKGSFNPVSEKEDSQLNLKKVILNIRVDEPLTFNVTVEPKNHPVDFYYLMDLSASMSDDLESVGNLATNISDKLSQLTTNHRLAFGTFVDKEIDPYVAYEGIGVPFDDSSSVPHDFHHLLNFTDKKEKFAETIKSIKSSGNRDVPEGTLDALMQIASCEKELQWGSKDTTRRIVLVATDGIFHMAGEGRFGGVVKPHDGKCYLTGKDGIRTYSKSLEMDYPSVSHVLEKLQSASIVPIFAVSAALKYYKPLEKTYAGVNSDILNEDSSNIIKLIEDSYNKIVSSVQLIADNDDNVDVNIKSYCGSASTVKGDTAACNGVGIGKMVSFDVTVNAKSCEKNNSSFSITIPSFGTVEVELNVICNCDCQKEKGYNSSICSGHGTLVCGRCDCNPGWTGKNCQCEYSSDIGSTNNTNCKNPNSAGDLTCSGNGFCDCGVCSCNQVRDTGRKYYGPYCECDDFNCEQYNGQLCGGTERGTCKCHKCHCKERYIGSNCGQPNCAVVNQNCLAPDSNGTPVNCSGHGKCDCGVCICDGLYQGPKCDSCLACAGKCDEFKQCVLCKVFREDPENKTLCDNCPEIKILKSLESLKAVSGVRSELCEFKDKDGCTYSFSYGGNTTTTIYATQDKVCPEGPNLPLIILPVIGGILLLGIILLILWKLLTSIVDRREYKKFEQERARSKWHREKNPLYKPATSTVQNPTFSGTK